MFNKILITDKIHKPFKQQSLIRQITSI